MGVAGSADHLIVRVDHHPRGVRELLQVVVHVVGVVVRPRVDRRRPRHRHGSRRVRSGGRRRPVRDLGNGRGGTLLRGVAGGGRSVLRRLIVVPLAAVVTVIAVGLRVAVRDVFRRRGGRDSAGGCGGGGGRVVAAKVEPGRARGEAWKISGERGVNTHD